MPDNKEILDAIIALRRDMTDRMGAIEINLEKRLSEIETRLTERETASRKQRNIISSQRASIEELQRRVEELTRSNAAIWESLDKKKVGLDRETAYRAFGELGYTPHDALRELDSLGLIRKSGNHYTHTIRKKRNVIRAVVIFKE